MELTFLGTRGNTRVANSEHRRHSSLLVVAEDTRVLVDAGHDWRGMLEGLAPTAILVTHAHPDHAGALADGAPCPVYASAATHDLLARYPLQREVLPPGVRKRIGALVVTAHQVAHSLRAPAVGFRIEHARKRIFYVPDVLELVDPADALRGVGVYIGDGATHGRAIVRYRDGEAFGHSTIETQLGWCAEHGVREAAFTHCGSRIIRRPRGDALELVRGLGEASGVSATIAEDGATLRL